jgi:ceramide glucosyltransferase
LLALQWCAAVFGSHVIWRGARVPIDACTSKAARNGALNVMDVMETSDGG